MNKTTGKFFPILKLVLASFLCGVISLGIFTIATPFIYAVWHCPPPRECGTPFWAEWIVLCIFLSPLLVFSVGAYLCRKIAASISGCKIFRVVILILFAFFPLFAFAGLIAYIISDIQK